MKVHVILLWALVMASELVGGNPSFGDPNMAARRIPASENPTIPKLPAALNQAPNLPGIPGASSISGPPAALNQAVAPNLPGITGAPSNPEPPAALNEAVAPNQIEIPGAPSNPEPPAALNKALAPSVPEILKAPSDPEPPATLNEALAPGSSETPTLPKVPAALDLPAVPKSSETPKASRPSGVPELPEFPSLQGVKSSFGLPALFELPALFKSSALPKLPALPRSPSMPGIHGYGNPLDRVSEIAAYKISFFQRIAVHEFTEAIAYLKALIILDTYGDIVPDILKLLCGSPCDLLTLAMTLWKDGSQDIVTKYFPDKITEIVKGLDGNLVVTIKNVGYNLYLASPENTDRKLIAIPDKNPDRTTFKMIPNGCENNNMRFKLFNERNNVYVSVDPTADSIGDHQVLVTEDANDKSSIFSLRQAKRNGEPIPMNGTNRVYTIENCMYDQPVKLATAVKSDGTKDIFTNGNENPNNSRETPRFHYTIEFNGPLDLVSYVILLLFSN